MAYQTKFESRPSYLFVKVTGTNSAATIQDYARDIFEECIRLSQFRILIHQDLDGPHIEPMQLFELVAGEAMKYLGEFDAIAHFDERRGNMTDFAETIAVNRGLPLRMFANVADAASWLDTRDDDVTGNQRIFNADPRDEPPVSQ